MDFSKNTSAAASKRTLDSDLLLLPGGTLLKRILENENPGAFVRRLSAEDFFWVVKQIGEDDCLPILELAGEEQWQYLIDLDIWEKDTLSTEKALVWLKRLAEADPERLSDWLFGEEQPLISFLLYQAAEIVIKTPDEEGPELSEAYFTLDGVFYIKALREENREMLEELLRTLAQKNHELYQGLLYELASMIPAEAEEELYRLRNGRIAEHGFVPFEEAISVYAPLDLAALQTTSSALPPGKLIDKSTDEFVPVVPLRQVENKGMFSQTLANISDGFVLERIAIEFADLANRIIAAGNFSEISDPEILKASCLEAAAYLNIAVERLSNNDMTKAADTLEKHSVIELFRFGYGLAVDLQKEAGRWRKQSWFFSRGWGNDFWGARWEHLLDGLFATRPLFSSGGQMPYRNFETINDLDETRKNLHQMQALDTMMARLSPLVTDTHFNLTHKTFHSILFNRWAHQVLEKEPSVEPLSQSDAARFFAILRNEETHPPYRMASFKDKFIAAFMEGAVDFKPEETNALFEALNDIWEDFRREYEDIKTEDIESRFSPFVLISGAA